MLDSSRNWQIHTFESKQRRNSLLIPPWRKVWNLELRDYQKYPWSFLGAFSRTQRMWKTYPDGIWGCLESSCFTLVARARTIQISISKKSLNSSCHIWCSSPVVEKAPKFFPRARQRKISQKSLCELQPLVALYHPATQVKSANDIKNFDNLENVVEQFWEEQEFWSAHHIAVSLLADKKLREVIYPERDIIAVNCKKCTSHIQPCQLIHWFCQWQPVWHGIQPSIDIRSLNVTSPSSPPYALNSCEQTVLRQISDVIGYCVSTEQEL